MIGCLHRPATGPTLRRRRERLPRPPRGTAALRAADGVSAGRFDLVKGTCLCDLGQDLALVPRDPGNGIREDPECRGHLALADGQGWRHPDARLAALEHEEAAL